MKGSINDQSTYKLGGKKKINVHQNCLEGKTKGDYGQSGSGNRQIRIKRI